VVVAGIQREQDLPAHGVAEVELVGAGRVAFRPDAEQFGFHRVTLYLASIFFLKTASSASTRRSRGPRRSAGVSFMPSGIQKLLRQVSPRALPMAAPISRERMPVLDPKLADGLVGAAECHTATTFEWAKKVGLKSRPILIDRAHAIQFLNWSTLNSSRSTLRPFISA